VADLCVVAARAAGSSVPRDGYSWPYVAAVCYGSALYGVLALLLSLRAGSALGLDSRYTTLAAGAVWLGTPLLFYTHIAPAMAHAVSAFSVALFMVVWLRVRNEWSFGGGLALGAAGALMVMVREQDVSFMVAPAVDLALHLRQNPRQEMRRVPIAVAGAAIAFAAAFVPQALSYLALNGRIGPAHLVSRKMNWMSPHAWEVLASPQHGLFLWTPLAVLALGGVMVLAWRLWHERPWPGSSVLPLATPGSVAAGLCAALAAQVYLLGSLESWTSAGAFGQRRFVGSTILLVIGLSALFSVVHAVHTHRVRRLGLALVGLAVWWNLALMAEFGTNLMNRQRLELTKNAYDAFVTIPVMVPELAYRYFFDRSSFYGSSALPPPGH
jgi:hypothetical protein